MCDDSSQNNKKPTSKKKLSTKDRQRLFLEAFAEQGNVLVAARNAGIDRSHVYTWLEHDEDFSFAFNQAKEDAKDILRAEIYRRAKEGYEEDVYQLGHFAGTVTKYSDTLLIFHAKMLMPEYRDKSQIDMNAQVQSSNLTDDLRLLSSDQLAVFKQWLVEAQAKSQSSQP